MAVIDEVGSTINLVQRLADPLAQITESIQARRDFPRRNSSLNRSPQATFLSNTLQGLPTELLSAIFRLVDVESPLPLISKSLLPYQRAELYKTIHIDSIDRFKALRGSTKGKEELIGIIEEVILEFELAEEDIDEGVAEDLLEFTTSITHATRVVVRNSTSIAQMVLSREFAENALGGVEVLEFEGCFEGMVQVDLSDQFFYIEMYPNLVKLSVEITNLPPPSSRSSSSEEEEEEDEGQFDTIHMLQIIAPLSHPQIIKFVSRFSHIAFLSLSDNSSTPSFHPILSAIDTSVRSLDLRQLRVDSKVKGGIEGIIGRFTELDALSIDENLITPSFLAELVDPLRIVELSFGPLVKDQDFGSLVGAGRMSSLRKLSLEMKCEVGMEGMRDGLVEGVEREGIVLLDGAFFDRI